MFCKNCGKTIESNNQFCKNCGAEAIKRKSFYYHFTAWIKEYKKIFIGLSIVIIIVLLIALFGSDNSTTSNNTTITASDNTQSGQGGSTSQTITSVNQNTIAKSVVDILCTDGSGNVSGGSGTLISSDGGIITNNHIIPEDTNGTPTVSSCVITLPDTQGKVMGIYTAAPVVYPSLSQEYDIAFFQINGLYSNGVGITQGLYPTTFPDYYDSGCFNDNVTLGEAVRVFGYPAISDGGYNLTITNGIVSSLPDDGTIITSAEVDHGDSGGLAVDENGCMIGIPSMVSSDGTGSLGSLISNSLITKFIDALPSTNTTQSSQ